MTAMFEVDPAGYRAQMAEMKPVKVIYELIANANDEDSVKNFTLKIDRDVNGSVGIRYQDDGAGFKKISDVWTLYGHSERRSDPKKSGRFNLGEKEFLVLAKSATIVTYDRKTKQNRKFVFENNTRTEVEGWHYKHNACNGTTIFATFDRWNKEQFNEICKDIQNIYVKPDKTCTINEQVVKNEKPHKTFTAELPTLLALKEGQPLSKVNREAEIDLYDKKSSNSDAWLFENGLPIQKQSPRSKWHINVNQKVPLAPTRVSVPSSYWNKVCGAVLNNTSDELDHEESGAGWVKLGLPYASKESAEAILKAKFPNADPDKIFLGGSDHSANEEAIRAGGAIISSGTFGKEITDHLMSLGIVSRASEKYGSKGGDAIGRYAETEQVVKPSEAMIAFANVCKRVARDCIDAEPTVKFVSSNRPATAWYTRAIPSLTFNVKHLGMTFFDQWKARNVQLLIHELSHHNGHGKYEYEIEHYSKQFVDELERIGGIIGEKGIERYQ